MPSLVVHIGDHACACLVVCDHLNVGYIDCSQEDFVIFSISVRFPKWIPTDPVD